MNNTLTIIIFALIVLVVVRYSRREKFSDDSEAILTDFLTTQKAQTDEISKIFTVNGNIAKTSKEIKVQNYPKTTNNPSGGATHFNHPKPSPGGYNYIRGEHTVVDTPTTFNKGATFKKDTIMEGEMRANNGIVIGRTDGIGGSSFQGTWRKVNDNDSHMVGYGPVNERKITIFDQLCIGGTCINEKHLQALTEQRPFTLYHPGKGHIDCGLPEHGNSMCYFAPTEMDNVNQKFYLRLKTP